MSDLLTSLLNKKPNSNTTDSTSYEPESLDTNLRDIQLESGFKEKYLDEYTSMTQHGNQALGSLEFSLTYTKPSDDKPLFSLPIAKRAVYADKHTFNTKGDNPYPSNGHLIIALLMCQYREALEDGDSELSNKIKDKILNLDLIADNGQIGLFGEMSKSDYELLNPEIIEDYDFNDLDTFTHPKFKDNFKGYINLQLNSNLGLFDFGIISLDFENDSTSKMNLVQNWLFSTSNLAFNNNLTISELLKCCTISISNFSLINNQKVDVTDLLNTI